MRHKGQIDTSGPTRRLMRLTRVETVGIYATDAQGRAWATFANSNGWAVACALCGADITRRWWRQSDNAHICSTHVELVGVR